MGLVRCPDCGKEISSIATICINCGRPMNIETPFAENAQEEIKKDLDKIETGSKRKGIGRVFLLIALGIAVFVISFCKPTLFPKLIGGLAIFAFVALIGWLVVKQIGSKEAKRIFSKTLLVAFSIVIALAIIAFLFERV